MIIVDTSIWIEYLRGILSHSQLMAEFIERRDIKALDCVFGELLQGSKGKRERDIILQYWQYLPKLHANDIFINAGIYSNDHKLFAKGIGLIDALIIVSAIEYSDTIWTLDKKILNYIKKEYKFLPVSTDNDI